MALQLLVRNYFWIENVVAIRLAENISKLPAVTDAERCTLVHYDNDATPGFHYYESDGAALNISDITGSTHARIIKCPKFSKQLAGFDEDLSKFEDLADTPPAGGNAQEDTTPPEDSGGWLSTIQEESEADLEAYYMETWYTELLDEKDSADTVLLEDFHTVPM